MERDAEIRRERGYTLIELVAVMVVISLLAASAIPRMALITDEAHKALVSSIARVLKTSVDQVRMVYALNGLSGAQDNVAGYGDGTIDTNAFGYPTDTRNRNTVNNASCERIWVALMQTSSSASRSARGDPDFRVSFNRRRQECIYTYQKDPNSVRRIIYSALSGDVTATNP
jgi:MSHA pilin protein MshB